jgi:hypothetical protein
VSSSKPSRPEEQPPVAAPEPDAAAAATSPADAVEADGDAESDAPLNRDARRAKVKQVAPSHVGPQGGHSRQGRGPRSATKRPV